MQNGDFFKNQLKAFIYFCKNSYPRYATTLNAPLIQIVHHIPQKEKEKFSKLYPKTLSYLRLHQL